MMADTFFLYHNQIIMGRSLVLHYSVTDKSLYIYWV